MTAEERRKQIKKTLGTANDWIKDLSEVVGICYENDEDISDLVPDVIGKICVRIFAGDLLPEIYSMFAITPKVFQKLASLNTIDQKKIVDGKPIKVATGINGTKVDHVNRSVSELTKEERDLVFAPTAIRTPEEQWKLKNKPKTDRTSSRQLVMTSTQAIKLEKSAKRLGLTVNQMILNALEAAGLI